MALIIFDHAFACAPLCGVHIANQPHAFVLERRGRRVDVVSFQIEMEVLASAHERDAGVGRIHKFQVKELTACANACIEVAKLKLKREPMRALIDAFEAAVAARP